MKFVETLKPRMIIQIEDKKFKIIERIWWKMLKADDHYYKFVLEDEGGSQNYRLAFDDSVNKFIFVEIFENNILEPFPKEVVWQGKKFKFTYNEECIVENVLGKQIYKIGDKEVFSDYESDDGSYMSLGRNLGNNEREDLIGRWVEIDEIKVID
ncbi:MAG: hypothetical protein ISS48_04890 [Candidatus Aenigmarchaeota archaeon]|nr:hypothetical protein [Candidatus Aenigmarchaeota archaeon]